MKDVDERIDNFLIITKSNIDSMLFGVGDDYLIDRPFCPRLVQSPLNC